MNMEVDERRDLQQRIRGLMEREEVLKQENARLGIELAAEKRVVIVLRELLLAGLAAVQS
jgi:hypothetical protein